jgi:hypothetical protein
MKHLEFTAEQLRQAYQRAGSQPAYGWWFAVYKHEGGKGGRAGTYECPLHLLYGTLSVDGAINATQAPEACINGWLDGWDGDSRENLIPGQCVQCYQLGAALRAELNPTRISA